MKIKTIHQINEIASEKNCAVALGAFDGLHAGHMRVIREVVGQGMLTPAVFTFSENPHGGSLLAMSEEKEKVLRSAGVEILFVADFSAVKRMPPEQFFLEILLKRCKAKLLCCGGDFRFGKNAAGDITLLRKLCRKHSVALRVMPPLNIDGEKVSSTRIRQAIERGDMKAANRMLGRPFSFSLEVIHGNHIGQGLGTPTINQALPSGFILPKFGVYASYVRISGKDYYYGVTNIGVKPTVGSDSVLSETWIPEFSGDLYGKRVRLYLLDFIRPEQKFGSLEEMKAEILCNARQARDIAACFPPPFFTQTVPISAGE